MPSRMAISEAWTAQDRAAARREMEPHAAAERACVKVSGDTVTLNRSCMKKAVPKGTNKNLWTE